MANLILQRTLAVNETPTVAGPCKGMVDFFREDLKGSAKESINVDITISGIITVKVEAKTDTGAWIDIQTNITATTSDIAVSTSYRYVRINVTAAGGGTVSAVCQMVWPD